jgi:hypothetical protein
LENIKKKYGILFRSFLRRNPIRIWVKILSRACGALLGKPTLSPFSSYFSFSPYIVGVLVVLLALPLGYRYISGGSNTAVFAMNQEIQNLKGDAYGTLTPQEAGRGGLGGVGLANTAPAEGIAPTAASAPAADSAATSGIAKSATAFATNSTRMISEGPVTVYSYVYKGEPLNLSSTDGLVYSRVVAENSSAQVSAQLRNSISDS